MTVETSNTLKTMGTNILILLASYGLNKVADKNTAFGATQVAIKTEAFNAAQTIISTQLAKIAGLQAPQV